MAVEQVLGAQRVLRAEIDEREVGVRAGLDPALARDAEALGGAGRRQPRDRLERQRARGGPREQQLERRLAAGDPAPRLAERALP